MIVDGKLGKKGTNGQTSFYIKKLENELSQKTDTYILAQTSPSPIIYRTPSQFTFTDTVYCENEITSLYKNSENQLQRLAAMKSFVIEQILLVKHLANHKFNNNSNCKKC